MVGVEETAPIVGQHRSGERGQGSGEARGTKKRKRGDVKGEHEGEDEDDQ